MIVQQIGVRHEYDNDVHASFISDRDMMDYFHQANSVSFSFLKSDVH